MNTTILIVAATQTTAAGNDWNITEVANAETAIEKIQQTDFDIIVLTANVAAEQKKLQSIVSFQQPGVVIVVNNDESVLREEIAAAIATNNKTTTTYSFVDDGLKNAMLPITIQ
jgi:hypothetical protein